MSNSRMRSKIIESLIKKGFVEKKGGDHWRFIFYTSKGKKSMVHTRISRGSKYKSLGDNMLAQMAKQCCLSKADFLDLIDCPMSHSAYEEQLIESGMV